MTTPLVVVVEHPLPEPMHTVSVQNRIIAPAGLAMPSTGTAPIVAATANAAARDFQDLSMLCFLLAVGPAWLALRVSSSAGSLTMDSHSFNGYGQPPTVAQGKRSGK